MKKSDSYLVSLFQIGVGIHQFNRRSEKELGLSLVQWCILKHLIDMPAAPAQSLAKIVGVHPSTLTQTLKRLERKKYIYVSDDPKDTRKKNILITRFGKDVLHSTTEKMEVWSKGLSNLGNELLSVKTYLQAQISRKGQS